MKNHTKKTAIVTGATRGIGLAIAKQLLKQNYQVVINSAHSAEVGKSLAQQFEHIAYLQADVSQADQCQQLIQQTVQQFGSIDVLVNNAAVSWQIPHEDLDAVTPQVWEQIFHTNVFAIWHLSRFAKPYLATRNNANIINISSVAGSRPMGSSIPYATSKAALNHMTRLLAKTLAPTIRVNAIAPGFIVTERTQSWTKMQQQVFANTPLQRNGTPEDISQAVTMILQSPFLTGEIITLDGGFSLAG
jgi:ketoreductase RED2